MSQKVSAEKLALLAELRRQRGLQTLATRVAPLPRPGPLPVSLAQEHVWFAHQLREGASSFNQPMGYRLRGPLSVPALERALQAVVDRHEVLRSTFHASADGQLTLRVPPHVAHSLSIADLRGLDAESQAAERDRVIALTTGRPFDLSRGPLVRSQLITLTDREHLLIVTSHHIVWDGQSWAVFLTELSEGYRAFCSGGTPALPPLPVQFADCVAWKRERVGSLDSQRSYWAEKLAHVSPLELPTHRARPAEQTQRAAFQALHVPAAVTRRLEEIGRERGATLFMTLLAAYKVHLRHHTLQADVCVGVPVAGRDAAEMEPLIGYFVNMLAVRSTGRPADTFLDAVNREREAMSAALSHQQLPFERVVNELKLPRDLSRAPVFQTIFDFYPADLGSHEIAPGLELEQFYVHSGWEKFDLTLELLGRQRDGVSGAVSYSTDLFDGPTMARFVARFQHLMEQLADHPRARLDALELLDPAERRQLVEWNATEADEPEGGCVHRLFEEQARKTPEAVAVQLEGQTLSYAELDRRANQLARRLGREGVGPEGRVGVCMERSLEMVVALLGTLKAGGAYVPLDPGYPKERLAFMLEDAKPKVLLTQARLLEALPARGIPTLCLDAQWAEVAAESAESPAVSVLPANLAYVIYTSGSTGRPKGAMNAHRAVCNRLTWMQREYRLGADDVVLQKTPFSFDVSVWEFFWPLLAGARLVLARPEGHKDATYLAQLIASEGVTTLHFVPSMLSAFLVEPAVKGLKPKRVICSGEALAPSLLERFFETMGGELHNLYGPTEAAVDVTSWACVRGEVPASVPIGRPISNTQLYVLDASLRPLPVGVPGDLYIGGVPVGRGYLNRPELTAEKFIPNPFSGQPGERLYVTGDVARYLPDGAIEYLGRSDFQVKVRGFRIELGEIEVALARHPAVEQCVVVAREEAAGEKRLVAYCVPRKGGAATATALQEHLKQSLPEHMVPAAFVTLEALPLLPNGKVDRKALPAPQWAAAASSYVAPRTPVEEVLAAIWRDVLKLERVGVHDDFFALGGDSISGMRMVARARQAGWRLKVRQLFERPVLGALASVAEPVDSSASEPGEACGAVVATPIMSWFFEQRLAEPQHWNQSVLLELTRQVPAEVLQRALSALVEHHDMLRLRRGPSGLTVPPPSPVEGLLRKVALPDVGLEQSAAVIAEHSARAQSSLDLERGPLVRAVLFEGGRQRRWQRLVVVAHHLAVDAHSWGILEEDLETACAQLLEGEPLRLPAKTTAFRRWAALLAQHAGSAAAEAELGHWQALPWSRAAPLPVDEPEGPLTEADAGVLEVALGAEDTAALMTDVHLAYRTQINDVLLTALAASVADWSGQRCVHVDVEGHGREELFAEADLSRTVGWFTTLSPVIVNVEPQEGPGETLKRVKEHLRSTPRRGIGYGLLRYVRGSQALAAHPASGLLFNYLGRAEGGAPQRLFTRLEGDRGPHHSPKGKLTHPLTIDAEERGGQLHVRWTYAARYRRQTVEALAAGFLAALRRLVAHCMSGAHGYTPSDFPLASLDQTGIDQLLGKSRGVADVYPLTPAQQGMLFHSLRDPRSGVYVQQQTWRCRELDARAFERAWAIVMARHEPLRASFLWALTGEPLQIVWQAVEPSWDHQDWSDCLASEQDRRLEAYLAGEAARGFDFSRAPLARFALIRLSADEHQFVWCHHHTVLDGWSWQLLLDEVLAVQRQLSTGQPVELRSCRPYRDYVAWLKGQSLPRAEAHWREVLSGFAEPTPLPLAGPGQAGDAGIGRCWVDCPETEAAAVTEMARRNQLTLNSVVQAAWAVLLGRYGGRQDVVFGATVSGRPEELTGSEAMVGNFITTLPARVRWSSTETVLALLARVQAQQVQTRDYEYSPLAQVQAWSGVPKGQPLFDSAVVFENFPRGDATAELSHSGVRVLERTNFPLSVLVMPGPTLRLGAYFELSRYSEPVVLRLVSELRRLLSQMASRPHMKVGELELLTDAEKRRQLVEWNATEADEPEGGCVHRLFEEQARKTPEAVAVQLEGQTLSYAELDRRANQLARRLGREGVGPEGRVGVCMERSLEMVVALLGTLKAGGAYVPLDPGYPKERLAFMLEDAKPKVLLTQARLLEALPARGIPTLCLDAQWAEVAAESAESPAVSVLPANLAYVIYTSGSTGRPKGAMNAHRAVCNRLTWMQREYRLGADDVVLQKTPFSFDVSVWEFFWPLLAGARLVLARPEGHKDATYLAQLIASEGVTTLHFVPSMLSAFLVEPAVKGLKPKRVICSGEALAPSLLERFFETMGGELHNLYGPTEAAVDVTSWACVRGEVPASVPIGRPISNTQLYVLDASLRPLPVGVPGDLYIGGVPVGRGYLNRPELTAEKFIPNPFSGQPGERLYVTGDVARYLPDGAIEYLGRSDFQVKVRGFRIELGEIEVALARHPAVEQCVVVAREEAAGEKRLVAYCVPRKGGAATATALQEHLKQSLPEHMVPAAFVTLEALPLLPNGKVDRKALPAPQWAAAASSYVAPRTPVEEVLAAIWRDVLKLERVGVHDDFFALGGDSISTVRVAAIAQQAGLEVTVGQVFTAPTVELLAGLLGSGSAAAEGSFSVVRKVPAAADAEVPLSVQEERMARAWSLSPADAWAGNAWSAQRLEGPLDVEALQRSFSATLARYDVLRSRYAFDGGRISKRVLPAVESQLEVVDLGGLPAERREDEALRRIAKDACRRFDITREPLLTLTAYRLSPDQWWVLLLGDHTVVDERSVTMLWPQLAMDDASGDQPALQYVDFARWQRTLLQGPSVTAAAEAWTAYLAGSRPITLDLPVDLSREAVQARRAQNHLTYFEIGQVRRSLADSLVERLTASANREKVSVFMAGLAAFASTLGRWARHPDVTVSCVTDLRSRLSGLDQVIGTLAVTTLVRVNLTDARTVRDVLGRARRSILQNASLPPIPLVPLVFPKLNDLFRVVFNFIPGTNTGQWRGHAAHPHAANGIEAHLPPQKYHHDLNFGLVWVPGDSKIVARYNAELWAPATMERFVDEYLALLEQIALDPTAAAR